MLHDLTVLFAEAIPVIGVAVLVILVCMCIPFSWDYVREKRTKTARPVTVVKPSTLRKEPHQVDDDVAVDDLSEYWQ